MEERVKRVMVQLTEEQDAWLAAEAERRSTSKAHVVREMVMMEKLGSDTPFSVGEAPVDF